jgi:hypothetical protein
MDEQDDNVESETPVLKRSPRVAQRHTLNNVSNRQGAMVKEDDDEAEINEEENQVVKKNTQQASFNRLVILNGKKYKPFSYVFLPFSIYETV